MEKIDLNKVNFVEVNEDFKDVRIDKFIKELASGATFGVIQKKFRKGEIKLNNKKCSISDRLNIGDIVRVPPFKNLNQKTDIGFNQNHAEKLKNIIIFENDEFIIIDKPNKIACQGGKNVGENIDLYIKSYNIAYNQNLKLVHRIDKETSGILIIAKSRQSAIKLTEGFRNRKINKVYLTVCQGVPKPEKGIIDQDIFSDDKEKPQKAKTYYEVIGKLGQDESLLFMYPYTGRKHQLRVHLSNINHPIIGDEKYSTKSDRMYLHAFGVKILGETFFTKVPKKFEYRLQNMGISNKELLNWGEEWINL